MRVLPVVALLAGTMLARPSVAAPGDLPVELLRAQAMAPLEGTPAPDFTLEKLGSEEVVTLSTLRARPVVLVFGSYT